ncbi:MAG TPA: hypothetical protein VGP22_04075 [Albitalea sp.]|jgi:hypothetical protein|nr:hypothetical protein [Albitalea sp.]
MRPVYVWAALVGSATASAQPQPTAPGPAPAATVIRANPDNYLDALRHLRPGDTLLLEPGRYGVDAAGQDTARPPGLPIFGLHGQASAPITITGPDSGPLPVLLGRPGFNTVRIGESSHVVIRNLEVDNRDLGANGVVAQGPTHDITLENLSIRGVGDDQSTVAIAVNRAPAWQWTVRCNRIAGAGTGMYFGNSDGRNPFVAGLIEHNVVLDTIGYNVEVKHQREWGAMPAGMPVDRRVTVIRHNIFSKRSDVTSAAGARPNLLVGDQPPSGPGSQNGFEIYGNFFYENPLETLFQGEGNIAFHDNLLVNTRGDAVRIQPHNGAVRTVHLFSNTVVARDTGILVKDGQPGSVQRVVGNAVFAAEPVRVLGADASEHDNVTGSTDSAARHLRQPHASPGELDLRPKPGRLTGRELNTVRADLRHYTDWDRSFDGALRDWRSRGAYSPAANGGDWLPQLEIKPPPSGARAPTSCRR